MSIDWVAPFKLAFEVGMFALGWALITVIVIFFLLLAWGLINATVATIRGANRKSKKKKLAAEIASAPEGVATISFPKG